jgi:hypothetical protein
MPKMAKIAVSLCSAFLIKTWHFSNKIQESDNYSNSVGLFFLLIQSIRRRRTSTFGILGISLSGLILHRKILLRSGLKYFLGFYQWELIQ